MGNLFQDLRYGARMLLKHPGFSLIAVITLALAIGANTAIFSVINGVLLRPLPFKNSERLVMVWNIGAEAAGGDRTPLAAADLVDWRTQNHTFESIGAYQQGLFNYSGGDVPEQVLGAGLTSNFLSVLGVNVQLGRGFDLSDEQVGAPRVILLSDHFWRTRFNADPQVIGRAINLSGVSTTIIGVMPANFRFPDSRTEIWRAIQLEPPTRRGPYFFTGLARLKNDVSLNQARADTTTMKSRFDGGNFNFNIVPINDFFVGDVRPTLIALLVAVTLVLLIAAVNVANLTLVHASSRFKEISIRAALGASRTRIAKRLLTESLLLAVVGGTLGTLLAFWGVSLLVKLAPENLPRLDEIRIDGWVLGWTALITILTAVLFGLAPALQSSRLNLNEALRDGSRTTEGSGRRRGRKALVVMELALAVMLLSGAGLLIKSLWKLQHVDIGINPDNVLTMQLSLWGQRYQEEAQARDFNARFLDQLKSIPGVKVAALSNSLPPDETEFSSDFRIEGQSHPADAEPPIAYFNRVSPDYFQALGIPLRSGRLFNNIDTPNAAHVVLINDTLRRRFFANEDPVGKRINLSNDTQADWVQIIGVVGDVKYNGMAEAVQPAIYQSLTQEPTWGISVILKSDVIDPLSLTTAVRSALRTLDPELPLTRVRTMEQRLSVATSQPRFRTSLIGLFAAVALVLACVGIYGVVSYSVTQRTHEIGIRIALGAQTGHVMRMVIMHALILATIGVILGVIASLTLTSFLTKLLFGVTPTDPAIFVCTAIVLGFTALVASYLPARRAAKVDPLEALKYE